MPSRILVSAVLLYMLCLASRVPLFNFGATLNVGLAAASLLPAPALKGATISEGYYARWTL